MSDEATANTSEGTSNMSEETATNEPGEPGELSFKVKSSSEGIHTINILPTATVLDLKNKLAGNDYEKIPAERQRLIYSGRVMKNDEPLSTYKIKEGNTVHMVKSAPSNLSQNPSPSIVSGSASGVPTNMAAGTANNPLSGLTGARFAGQLNLPDARMFGADGGMGAPPSEDAMASMLEDPNMQQTLNEALNNPDMINMMINSTPLLRNNPHAREMLQSPEFRQMMTNPAALRQAAQLRRSMQGGGAGSFPAPGITDTTPSGAPSSNDTQNQSYPPPFNPFGVGGLGAGNPFAQMFGGPGTTAGGQTPGEAGSTGTGNATQGSNNAQNPFTALMGGGGGPGGANPFSITPQMMQQILSGGDDGLGAFGSGQGADSGTPPAPADTRRPEERYADQLRQLNDMGFFDFDRNVAALRRSGGNVQGAVEQLLG